MTSSDVLGVVVMISRPSAVPNGPWRASCGLRLFLPWFGLTDGAMGAKEWKLGFACAIRARCGSELTFSDVSGVVVVV